MLKIFSKEEMDKMGVMTEKEVAKKYPNMAYIMIDCKEVYRVDEDGDKVRAGNKGKLYAIADRDSLKEYKETRGKLSQELSDKIKPDKDGVIRTNILSFNTFKGPKMHGIRLLNNLEV